MIRVGAALRRMTELPLADLDRIAPGTALVLAPHPDDESLGCGGLIAEACARGRPPVVVIVTDGARSHPGSAEYPPARLAAVRRGEAYAAVGELGLPPERLHFLDVPDTDAPTEGPALRDAAERVARLLRRYDASTMLASWRHDPHCDHVATDAIAVAAARLTDTPLLSYPVWGWLLPPDMELGAAPTGWRLNVADHADRKQRAIAAHASQYSDLIQDAPTGFRLPADLLAISRRPYEVFVRPE